MTSVLSSAVSSDKHFTTDSHHKKRRRSPSDEPVTSKRQKSPRNEIREESNENSKPAPKKDIDVANIYGKTGGAYIPPARLRLMQAQITDKSSEAYQRIAWEALKKTIHGFINKVNVSNISNVMRQLLCENIVRGRGLLVRSLITAQTASPTFTHVFSALIAIINSKFPQVGELMLKRLINEFRKAFRRNQKDRCLSTARFLAHLVNQKVVHELIILELLTLLLEQTTDDSVEVAIAVLKECGAILTKLVPKGVHGIFEHLRRILNEGDCDKRICYMLEVMFQVRRDGWKDHPAVLPELDVIQEDDQITHTTSLLDQVNPEDKLNVFHYDPDYLENEEKYAKIKASFFESDDEDSDAGDDDDDDDDDDQAEEAGQVTGDGDRAQGAAMTAPAGGGDQQQQNQQQTIIDQTETNLVHLRRTIYLMLQSSVSADEAGHRLLQLKIRPGEEYEVASMVLDCCAQTRSYETRYGRLAQRLCHVLIMGPPPSSKTNSGTARPPKDIGPGSRYSKPDPLVNRNTKTDSNSAGQAAVEDTGPPRSYVGEFERMFSEQYAIIHRLETAKLRNVALFFSHLLYTDSISWGVFKCVRLNERDTTSSGRIFLKHLLLELCSFIGLATLQNRLKDETLQPFFTGLLPKDNPKDTRFAINFLTTVGLGALTLDLRDHLQTSREVALAKKETEAEEAELTQLVDDESSENSSSSSDSDGDDERHRKHKNKKKESKTKSKKKHKTKKHKSPSKTHSGISETNTRRPSDDSSKKSVDTRLKHPRPLDTPFFNDTPNSPTRVLPVVAASSSRRDQHRDSLSPRSPPASTLRSAVICVANTDRQLPSPDDEIVTTREIKVQPVADHVNAIDFHFGHRRDARSPSRQKVSSRVTSPALVTHSTSSLRDRSPHADPSVESSVQDSHSRSRHSKGCRHRSEDKSNRRRSPHSSARLSPHSRRRHSKSRSRERNQKSSSPKVPASGRHH